MNLFVYNTELYALGMFDSVNNLPASNIAKYDGSNWYAIDTTKWGGHMWKAMMYQGNLYVCGNFWNYNGSIDKLAMWNGSVWQTVGGYVGGYNVNCFAIYNGDLWIGGGFSHLFYNDILRWDGTQWLDPGGGTNYPGYITCMTSYNNELWVGGAFFDFAGMPTRFLAKWNGTDWCTLDDTLSSTVNDMAVYNNELYIAGGFERINSDTVGYIAKWIGGNYSVACGNTTSTAEYSHSAYMLTVYPNPTTGTIHLTEVPGHSYAEVFDLPGKMVCRWSDLRTPLDLNAYQNGIYFLRITTPNGVITKKIVKE